MAGFQDLQGFAGLGNDDAIQDDFDRSIFQLNDGRSREIPNRSLVGIWRYRFGMHKLSLLFDPKKTHLRWWYLTEERVQFFVVKADEDFLATTQRRSTQVSAGSNHDFHQIFVGRVIFF